MVSFAQSIWDGRLFKFADLPEWMKDNEYITDMHRPQIKNIKSCLKKLVGTTQLFKDYRIKKLSKAIFM